jgi:hypothetical protein
MLPQASFLGESHNRLAFFLSSESVTNIYRFTRKLKKSVTGSEEELCRCQTMRVACELDVA